MVVKGAGVSGHEHSGTADAERQALGTAATIAGEMLGKTLSQITDGKKLKRSGPDLEAEYAANNPLYAALYDSYTSRGVDEGTAHKAAISRVSGEDAESNQDIAAADLAASRWTPSQTATNSANAYKTEEGSLSKSVADTPTTQGAQLAPSAAESHPTQEGSFPSAALAPDRGRSAYGADTVSQMQWLDLQSIAKQISQKTGLKPNGRKRLDIEAFVVEHGHELDARKIEKPAITANQPPTTEKDKIISELPEKIDDRVQAISKEESVTLTDNISNGYKARAVPPDQAEAASKDFAQGKDESNSHAISAANEQVRNPVVREPLHQMFYEALTKSGVSSELADIAGKDMAAGKGAKSSEYVKQAQNYALDEDIDKRRMSKAEKDWLRASRYNTTRDPRKRDREIAVQGHQNGMSNREVINMLKLSPVAAAEGKKDAAKGMQYIYTVQKKAERTVNQTRACQNNRLMRKGRGISV